MGNFKERLHKYIHTHNLYLERCLGVCVYLVSSLFQEWVEYLRQHLPPNMKATCLPFKANILSGHCGYLDYKEIGCFCRVHCSFRLATIQHTMAVDVALKSTKARPLCSVLFIQKQCHIYKSVVRRNESVVEISSKNAIILQRTFYFEQSQQPQQCDAQKFELSSSQL